MRNLQWREIKENSVENEITLKEIKLAYKLGKNFEEILGRVCSLRGGADALSGFAPALQLGG